MARLQLNIQFLTTSALKSIYIGPLKTNLLSIISINPLDFKFLKFETIAQHFAFDEE